MQAGGLYADVRIPMDRPELDDARCLADLPPDALAILGEAEGFAGSTRVQDSVFVWDRHLNWHGLTEEADAGRLSFDSGGDLLEDGVDADYAELWTRRAEAPAMADVLFSETGQTAYLLTVGTRFVFGIGTPDAPPSAEVLGGLERGRVDSVALSALFDRVHMLGTWRGPLGVADLATNPFLEGTVCLSRAEDTLRYSHIDFTGQQIDISLKSAAPSTAIAQKASG